MPWLERSQPNYPVSILERDPEKKEKCPDCLQCQGCSKTRCRACRKHGAGADASELGTCFTYGEYVAWKANAKVLQSLRNVGNRSLMRRVPVIDRKACTDCESCLEICPEVFRRNRETGLIEVADLPDYPEEEIREAIVLCPADCISWEEY